VGLALTWLTNHCPFSARLCHLTRKIIHEMTYNVLNGMLNPTIPYRTIPYHTIPYKYHTIPNTKHVCEMSTGSPPLGVLNTDKLRSFLSNPPHSGWHHRYLFLRKKTPSWKFCKWMQRLHTRAAGERTPSPVSNIFLLLKNCSCHKTIPVTFMLAALATATGVPCFFRREKISSPCENFTSKFTVLCTLLMRGLLATAKLLVKFRHPLLSLEWTKLDLICIMWPTFQHCGPHFYLYNG